MSSMNKVILIGNVGKDPEMRNTQAGKKIASFSVATSKKWKDRQSGEAKEVTEWHRIVVFNENVADVVDRFVKKGSKVAVEGALATRKWTDNSGIERYTTEVVIGNFEGSLVLLGDAGGGGGGDRSYGDRPASSASASRQAAKPAADSWGAGNDLDDEIPF
jgi:single-strand DNA-binding protein